MIELVSFSAAMKDVTAAAVDVAATSTTVLITGETGTGKNTLARFIHEASPRAMLPLTVINCGALNPDELTQSLAHGGTVVLDEIGALSFEDQGRVLRALELKAASRVVAISTRDLGALAKEGRFRSDLFYRIDVFPLRMPNLSERADDVPRLATLLLSSIASAMGSRAPALTEKATKRLTLATFAGHVRELANVLERAAVRSHGTHLDANELGLSDERGSISTFPGSLPLDLTELERLAIAEALRRVDGNRTHAARLLGIGLRTLRQKLNGRRSSTLTPAPVMEAQ